MLSTAKSVVSVSPWSYRERFLFHTVFVWLWVRSSDDGWQTQGQVSLWLLRLLCLGPEGQAALWADCVGRHGRTRAVGWQAEGGDQGWYVEAWLPLGSFDLQSKPIERLLVCVGPGWGGVGSRGVSLNSPGREAGRMTFDFMFYILAGGPSE